ncbi:MAG: hypothetical protein LBR24_04375 [Methanobrevibacter sp.]|jgi:hypothetical protein|nr:hypothetical protein [Methanobrevibacter sp.]
MTGIQCERVYFTLMYEGFERKKQALLKIQRGENFIPCDEITIENPSTGEEKVIYFDISTFYGKMDFSKYE